MILAAGLSPAWQQIVVLEGLAVGEVNRAREVHWCASGKVLNVGLAAHCLCASPPLSKGGPAGVARPETETVPRSIGVAAAFPASRIVSIVGGPSGDAICHEFADLGVSARWVASNSPTRVCTTIIDRAAATTTELVENARRISEQESALFEQACLEEIDRAEIVVLTGSLPAGVRPTLYRDLMAKTRERVILDAQGEPLLAALECRPFIVKPNREELGTTLGRSLNGDEELHAAMRELCRRGAEWVIVTQGKERVWLASEQELVSFRPPRVEPVNPIGCGDCLAAGVAVALSHGADVPAAVQYGIAAAAENARQLLPARFDPAQLEALLEYRL